MQKMIKALKDAQAVLANYLTPATPQQPNAWGEAYWQNRFSENEKVINDLLKILDNRELVEEQRKYIVGDSGDVACVSPVFPTVPASQMASSDPNVEAVRKMLLDRSALGLKKYGVGTNRSDLQLADWLQHLQEELCDAAVYVQAIKAGAHPHREELDKALDELEVTKKELQLAKVRETTLVAQLEQISRIVKQNSRT